MTDRAGLRYPPGGLSREDVMKRCLTIAARIHADDKPAPDPGRILQTAGLLVDWLDIMRREAE
jgi:hypothetical protein